MSKVCNAAIRGEARASGHRKSRLVTTPVLRVCVSGCDARHEEKSKAQAMATTSNAAARPAHASKRGSCFSPAPQEALIESGWMRWSPAKSSLLGENRSCSPTTARIFNTAECFLGFKRAARIKSVLPSGSIQTWAHRQVVFFELPPCSRSIWNASTVHSSQAASSRHWLSTLCVDLAFASVISVLVNGLCRARCTQNLPNNVA
jgi:hypothetical protein